MSKTTLSTVALAAAVVGAAAVAQAADMPAKSGSEKCYGVAKKGENACAAANGSHSCSGQSKVSYDGNEWKNVPKGSCEQMNGSLKPFQGENPKMKG